VRSSGTPILMCAIGSYISKPINARARIENPLFSAYSRERRISAKP
jgi:hypothetical protein